MFKIISELITQSRINNFNLELLCSSFWKHTADSSIRFVADQLQLPLIYLGDLGEREEMKAIGLFEHSGVANHPGDLGMKNIAERIFNVIKESSCLEP